MAGNRIKGITIEIGGDTSKLSDSLKAVDKQLRTTQTSLKDVNKLLKLDPTNTELLRQKHSLLGKAVEDTREKLKQEEEALRQLKSAGNTEENQAQQDALQRELVETRSKLADLEKQYIESEPHLAKFAATSQQVAEKTKKVSQVAAGLGAALVGNAYKAALAADDLNTLSRNTGIAVEELQKMQYASDTIDVSVDQMAGSLKKLTQQMGKGSDVFDTLGVNIYDANGNMRDAVDVWYDSLEALSQVNNETERDTLAMELFGRSAMDLSGIIDDGGAALRAMGDDAESMGLILSGDTLNAANEFNDAIDLLKARTSAAFLEAGAALATSLVPMLEKLVEKVTEVLLWFSDLDGETQTVIVTILGLVAAISPVASLFAGITTVVGGLSAALAFLVSPAGVAVVAIGGLIAAGVTLYQNWENISARIRQVWESIKNTVSIGVSRIKSLMSFSWSLPHIKLPHFRVSGGFGWSWDGGISLPHISVDWYRKAMQNGMILNSPTIFGMQNGRLLGAGEAGSETVVGTNSLMQMIQAATAASSGPVINVYASEGMDERRLAIEIERRLVAMNQAKKAVFQ